jgi:3-methylcrotonyl-CoA carboxylase alpha subunit
LGQWRFNHEHSRAFQFTDGKNRLSIEAIQTTTNGEWKLTFNGHTFVASGVKVNENGDISAHVNDRLHNYIVVEHSDTLHVFVDGNTHVFGLPLPKFASASVAVSGSMKAPMPGKITKVLVKTGDSVEKGAPLIIMEAMKMEVSINLVFYDLFPNKQTND